MREISNSPSITRLWETNLVRRKDYDMEEIWKDVVGYEGLYQISNLGRIKSVERFRKGKKGSKTYCKERI